ncbi:sigma factor-like helix-turn-helix DNA-binding protein [Sphingomonas sp. MMS24-JH45]
MTGAIADGMTQDEQYDAQVGSRRRLQQERLRADRAGGPRRRPGRGARRSGDGPRHRIDAGGTGAGGGGGRGGCAGRPLREPGLARGAEQLAGHLRRLPEREGVVVRQHYVAGLPFIRIADLLRLSRGKVAQLHRAALDRLGRRLRAFRER